MGGEVGTGKERTALWCGCQCFVQLCVCYQCSQQRSLSFWVDFSPALSLVSESFIWNCVQLLCDLQVIPANFKFSAGFSSLIFKFFSTKTWEMLCWFFSAKYKTIFKAIVYLMQFVVESEWSVFNGDSNILVVPSSPAPHSFISQLISGCLVCQHHTSQVGFISKMMTVIWFSLSIYFCFSRSRAS